MGLMPNTPRENKDEEKKSIYKSCKNAFLLTTSIYLLSVLSTFVNNNKDALKVIWHVLNNEKKCANIPEGCGDFTHVIDFETAFAQARKDGYDCFLRRNNQCLERLGMQKCGFIDMYTTEYLDEIIPRYIYDKRKIDSWVEDRFITLVSGKIAKLIHGTDKQVTKLLHLRYNENDQKEVYTQLDGTMRLNNRIKINSINRNENHGFYEPQTGILYVEYTYTFPFYLHEKLHKIDYGYQPNKIDSTIVLSHLDGFNYLFDSLLDGNELSDLTDKERQYLTSHEELFARFFSLFYYWEKYTGEFDFSDQEFIKEPRGNDNNGNNIITEERMITMLSKNYNQITQDIIPFIKIVSLQKLVLWMNWFYGYETDEAVGLKEKINSSTSNIPPHDHSPVQ